MLATFAVCRQGTKSNGRERKGTSRTVLKGEGKRNASTEVRLARGGGGGRLQLLRTKCTGVRVESAALTWLVPGSPLVGGRG